jgi:hypothetical protein
MVDRYTKIILTVIAIALSVIAFRDTTDKAYAQSEPVHVIIDRIESLAFVWGPVPVKIVN